MSTEIKVPDIGDFDAVEVIEILVSKGDSVEVDQALITLESDKATVEVPSTQAGTVAEIKVSEGDKVARGDVIVVLDVADAQAKSDEEKESTTKDAKEEENTKENKTSSSNEEDEQEEGQKEEKRGDKISSANNSGDKPKDKKQETSNNESTGNHLVPVDETVFSKAHASPSVRKYARELEVDLDNVKGQGRKGLILKEDVQAYVQNLVKHSKKTGAAGADSSLPEQPDLDYSQFGKVEKVKLSRIRKISARHVHKSWLLAPHVTQVDEADITELESFRTQQKDKAEKCGVKLTLLAFLLKASAATLEEFPDLNSSLAADGEHLFQKKYINIGVAVDTDDGLVVPVIRDASKKGIFDLAEELMDVGERARSGKLKREDLQGGCFSISSLGGIGGTAFTPIVNVPEVGILGVSRAKIKPVWEDDKNGGQFVPRLILPLSLSYDHRVIDGAMASRITRFLSTILGDIRKLLL